MDSLPTGSTQSWLIVTAVACSPTIILFLADAIGWLSRRAREKGKELASVKTQAAFRNDQSRTWPAGRAIAAFVLLSQSRRS